jgi:hypothetical protein
MDRQQIQEFLIEVLTQLQTESGHEPVAISGGTCPINGIPGFDSLTALEATVEVGRRLGRAMPLENIFVNDEGNSSLCIQEITERLHKILDPKVTSYERSSS